MTNLDPITLPVLPQLIDKKLTAKLSLEQVYRELGIGRVIGFNGKSSILEVVSASGSINHFTVKLYLNNQRDCFDKPKTPDLVYAYGLGILTQLSPISLKQLGRLRLILDDSNSEAFSFAQWLLQRRSL